jgi:hypothetical protein
VDAADSREPWERSAGPFLAGILELARTLMLLAST